LQVLLAKIAETYNPAYGHPKKTKVSGEPHMFQPGIWFCRAVLAPLLYNRWLSCIFVAFGAAQLMLSITGIGGWQCPIYATLGVICPGCGMTTAMAMLLRGHWQMAVQTHAFAPAILIVLILMLVTIPLPAAYLTKFCACVERLERKTGITAILLLSMMLYWLLRIFDFI
jgi:hypothetical protein